MNNVNLKYIYRTDTQNYKIKDIQKEIDECLGIIQELKIPNKNARYVVSISNRMSKTLGYCKRIKKSPLTYQITISNNHLKVSPAQEVHNTIMHEVLHSMPECMNHGSKWQFYGKLVQKFEPKYTLTRVSEDPVYRKYLLENSKYTVNCVSCGWKKGYQRQTKCINHIIEKNALGLTNTRYKCPICGSKELTVNSNNT